MRTLLTILNLLVVASFLSTRFQAEAMSKMTSDSNSKIDPKLLEEFQNNPGGKATILIEMKDSTKTALDEFNRRTFATREERLNSLNQVLTDFTQKSQKSVLDFLEKEKEKPNRDFTYESLWISNSITIKGGDLQLAEDLAKFPEIAKINAERKFDLLEG